MEFINQKGFFKDLFVTIQQSITDTEKSDFGKLTTDDARFEFIAKLECVKKMNFQCDVTVKNLSEALKLKQQGNVAFQNKNWIAALTLYSLSLLNTPEESGNSFNLSFIIQSLAVTSFSRWRWRNVYSVCESISCIVSHGRLWSGITWYIISNAELSATFVT